MGQKMPGEEGEDEDLLNASAEERSAHVAQIQAWLAKQVEREEGRKQRRGGGREGGRGDRFWCWLFSMLPVCLCPVPVSAATPPSLPPSQTSKPESLNRASMQTSGASESGQRKTHKHAPLTTTLSALSTSCVQHPTKSLLHLRRFRSLSLADNG